MRKNAIYTLAVWAFCTIACEPHTTKEDQTAHTPVEVKTEEVKPHMQKSMVTRQAELNGKTYNFQIHREPDSGLPEVKLRNGSSYMDNRIELLISQGHTEILRRTFTKNDFKDVVNARFMERAILEGLVYDRTEKGKFLFAASVCVPTTDLYIPARVLISPQGTITIEKEDSMDDTLDEELYGSGE